MHPFRAGVLAIALAAFAPALAAAPQSSTHAPSSAFPPSNLAYPTNPATYHRFVAVEPNVPSLVGGATRWSISPALPSGLELDQRTGVISGRALVHSPPRLYTVTARNPRGSTSATLQVRVVPPIVGQEVLKPEGGGTFFLEPHANGQADELRITEMFWGRLVDVHDVDANGNPSSEPVFRDFVVDQNVLSDGVNYELVTNPVTGATRLVILRRKGAPDTGTGTFDALLRSATQNLPPIVPKHDDGTSAPPFSLVARNATLVVRCDDLVADDASQLALLADNVKVLVGYPPSQSFAARIVFDPNHGGLTGSTFHSNRLLIDFTVSEVEAADYPVGLPVNALGLPESLASSSMPNVSVRIPTQVDFGTGQFQVLENLAGNGLATTGNGPVDGGIPTMDVVRAMRSGNPLDVNGGFLLDLVPPEVLGGWPLTVDAAIDAPGGTLGTDFVVDLTFATVCSKAPEPGDVVQAGSAFLEVVAPAGPPNPGGTVANVLVHAITGTPLAPGALLGGGLYQTVFDPAVAHVACWVSFTPSPGLFPSQLVQPFAQVSLRFNEPMLPASVKPFDTFRVVSQPVGVPVHATDLVVGEIAPSSDLRTFVFTPLLPLEHFNGVQEEYHVDLVEGQAGVTDLSGNALGTVFPPASFFLDPSAPSFHSESIVFRFTETNEIDQHDPDVGGNDDVRGRGQVFHDLQNGVLTPRPVVRAALAADRSNPLPSIMIPFPAGVQAPLVPLGAKLHQVWRYADLGLAVENDLFHNLDVEGLSWSPVGGVVVADFFREFEIRLAHASRLPDEYVDATLLPTYPASGLLSAPNPFAANVLVDPAIPQKVVHPRALGYLVSPLELFVAPSGAPMLPYPWNQGPGPRTTYTWRDTAILAEGAPDGAGVPLRREVAPPLFLQPGPPGRVAPAGEVPSFGLPLLMEYRAFPSPAAIGLNAFDVSLAINSSALPNFRVFSAGGVNATGQVVTKNPDLESVPSGGFGPGGNPTLPGDDAYYPGQVDGVVRVSRATTIWIDGYDVSTDWVEPVIEPAAAQQPGESGVRIEFRGATGFAGAATVDAFDAAKLDPYGDVPSGSVTFFNGVSAWTDDIDDLDGARYVQLRFTFENGLATGATATLDSVGLTWSL